MASLLDAAVAAEPVRNAAAAPRLVLAGCARFGVADGIADHGTHLRAALSAALGAAVEACERQPDGTWRTAGGRSARDLGALVSGCDALLLQYEPISYGRWGVAPWLPRQLAAVRRQGTRVGVIVHETAMPLRGLRSTAMGCWQRAQLRAVAASSDIIFASIEAWTRRIAGFRPRREVHHLPVGSNLPDLRALRGVARARLGLDAGDLAVATLSTGHPSHVIGPVRESLNRIAEAGHRVTLLRLGAGAAEVDRLHDAVRVHRPGAQSPELLAADMAAADIALMPYVDGVSTRRGGFMAALQHGVAVVGSDGPLTDSLLRHAGLALAPLDGIAAAARRLAADPMARDAHGAAGRRLYEQRFDWPVLARSVLAALHARAGHAEGRAQ